MKIYLVGGAVRDKLLGLPVKERDWVVVGASPQELMQKGFKPVGKDFPVFLHPVTHEEYALARTERKIAPGYTGFVFHAEPTVTLEQDLLRRDLTINAIAEDEAGNLIDPFGGKADLERKILRHVSAAFTEDPVRVLRIARFAARFPDFIVAEDTLAFMTAMVEHGEVSALVPERVFQELRTALSESMPERFFQILDNCQALAVIFPELMANTPAMQALIATRKKYDDPMIRFAAVFHNIPSVKLFCQRFRTPSDWSELAELTERYMAMFEKLDERESILVLLQKTDAYRRPERFIKWLQVCEGCLETEKAQQTAVLLQQALALTQSVSLTAEEFKQLTGKEIQHAIHQKRLELLKKM